MSSRRAGVKEPKEGQEIRWIATETELWKEGGAQPWGISPPQITTTRPLPRPFLSPVSRVTAEVSGWQS